MASEFKEDFNQLAISRILFNKERLVTALRLPLEVVESLTLHINTNPLYRELDVYVQAAVHSLTKDSKSVEEEEVTLSEVIKVTRPVTVTTEVSSSWWQHLKMALGLDYKTRTIEITSNVTFEVPVTLKKKVPVKKSYKKVFFGLPSNELAYRVYNMWPESDFEKSDEYWNDYILRHREAAMYMAPLRYKDIVKEVAVR